MVNDAQVPLALFLDRLAEEAGALADAAARAEVGLQTVLDRIDGIPAGAASDLQRVDFLRQGLEDLARLLWVGAAAATPPSEGEIGYASIAEAAVLSDLRARILTGPEASVESLDAEFDDVHIF